MALAARAYFAAPGTLEWKTTLRFRDWSQGAIEGDMIAVGNSTDPGGLYALSASTGKLLWSANIGKTVRTAIGGGMVFASSETKFPDYSLVAFGSKTGREAWRVPLGYRTTQRVGYSEGRVLAPKSEEAKLLAFDAASGKPAWTFSYGPGRGHCETGFATAPGAIYWGAGQDKGSIETRQKPAGNFLFAIDARTGNLLWKREMRLQTYDDVGECVKTPVFDGKDTLFSVAWYRLFAVDAASGAVKWQRDVLNADGKETETGSPAYTAGMVIVTGGGLMQGFRASGGQPVWKAPLANGGQWDQMAAADGVVYLGGLTAVQELAAVDAATGKLLWKASTPGSSVARDIVFSPGAVYGWTFFNYFRMAR